MFNWDLYNTYRKPILEQATCRGSGIWSRCWTTFECTRDDFGIQCKCPCYRRSRWLSIDLSKAVGQSMVQQCSVGTILTSSNNNSSGTLVSSGQKWDQESDNVQTVYSFDVLVRCLTKLSFKFPSLLVTSVHLPQTPNDTNKILCNIPNRGSSILIGSISKRGVGKHKVNNLRDLHELRLAAIHLHWLN